MSGVHPDISYQLKHWEKLTFDHQILGWVKGVQLEFVEEPEQMYTPGQLKFTPEEHKNVADAIQDFLCKGILEKTVHETGEFISHIFPRTKKSGKTRIILNLSKLNCTIKYEKFKLDSIKTVTNMIQHGCFMGSIDLTDAYYSIKVEKRDRKYLRFFWEGELYEFCRLPQGLTSAPRIFTKLLKPVFALLRSQGFESSSYLDDTFLQGDSFQECLKNIQATKETLRKLGFKVNEEKSVLIPTQEIEHLGFVINSMDMTISLTQNRKSGLKQTAKEVLGNKEEVKIRLVAKLIGLIVACEPAVEKCFLHYRGLELDKIQALKFSRGNFDANMTVSDRGILDINWWLENIDFCQRSLLTKPTDFDLYTDASMVGWGAYLPKLDLRASGVWSSEEQELHINVLELKAVLLGLESLCQSMKDVHILLHIDNMTAVAYVRQFGGTHSIPCNEVALNIWNWAEIRNIWLSSTHIEGVNNTEADRLSRGRISAAKTRSNITEWSIHPEICNQLWDDVEKPDVDLFASAVNAKCTKYVSWTAEADAWKVDAFSFSWTDIYFYAFPPFALLHRVLKRVQEDQATGLLVAPCWTTATWFPRLLKLLTDHPLQLPNRPDLLQLPQHPQHQFPNLKRLRLTIWPISGQRCRTEAYQQRLLTSSCRAGQRKRPKHMPLTSKNGQVFALNGGCISMKRM